jgi:hypothetical protein
MLNLHGHVRRVLPAFLAGRAGGDVFVDNVAAPVACGALALLSRGGDRLRLGRGRRRGDDLLLLAEALAGSGSWDGREVLIRVDVDRHRRLLLLLLAGRLILLRLPLRK